MPVMIHNDPMTDIHKTFCLNLSRLRIKLSLTQEEFAAKMNVGVRTAQRLEYGYKTGSKWPTPQKIRQVARILKVDTLDLFKPVKKT